ncbi:MAG: PEP-CTERM sorting domain-containing protein [Akkermansia sp.]|nr:PEP-CTERM sorting domain-containing protein [Akkermansia sp.]
MGISLVDAVVSGDGSTALSWDPSASEVTVVVTLNVDQLKEYMLQGKPFAERQLMSLYAVEPTTTYFTFSTSCNPNTNTKKIDRSGFYVQWLGMQEYPVGLGNSDGFGFEKESFWENASMAAVTFSYSAEKPGFTATFTLLNASGGILQKIPGEWADFDMSGITLSFSSVDFDTESVTSAYVFTPELTLTEEETLLLAEEAGRAELGLAVPEPTTATLSLLALAGLAARRRRASR